LPCNSRPCYLARGDNQESRYHAGQDGSLEESQQAEAEQGVGHAPQPEGEGEQCLWQGRHIRAAEQAKQPEAHGPECDQQESGEADVEEVVEQDQGGCLGVWQRHDVAVGYEEGSAERWKDPGRCRPLWSGDATRMTEW